MIQIIPTLLATTEEDYKTGVDQIESSGLFQDGWVQIDFMDNKFVQNKSIGLEIIAKYPINAQKEAQLMVIDPQKWLQGLKDLNFSRVIFPIEVGNTDELIKQIQDMEMKAGISINPETPLEDLKPFLDKIEVVLVMGVHPGFQGQQFIEDAFERVKQLAEKKENFQIGVDGGVSPENAKKLAECGADYLAVGSKLFKGDMAENMEKFWEVLNG